MPTARTTPPRPLDITTLVPALTPLARTATRLHPRPGSPTVHDSSVGGPLLWPTRHQWPHCEKWHEGARQPMIPVAQLYVRDVPQLTAPGKTDLLQILWCPSEEHAPDYKPTTYVFWRTAADVTQILTAPPQPSDPTTWYVPEPCVLAPERVTEYPHILELTEELRRAIAEEPGEEVYTDELSTAPGWKVGGWTRWGLTDPVPRFCVHCGTRMTPLLTIASHEWHPDNRTWIPYEDQAPEADANPPGVTVIDANHLQLYVCPKHPTHHTDLVQ
ncbi:hypothetical protein PV682_42460 [Streptomyces niveiscabiei]|uniref:hypothetical protein n=1 Tax=Streptomyces niveiscabiei TaxID=164115 RepID=UPI0029BB6EC6|nr:hypothetical protein [Streptomyces niveiscabiei]MDX3388057.1 hypothetical protein [Streptomyces niveiscabiei]